MKKENPTQKTFTAKRSSWLQWIGLLIPFALYLTGCSAGAVAPPDVTDPWKPPEETVAISPLSCDEVKSLFTYDAQAPLDVQEVSREREEGVTIVDLTYASPMGGRVPATLVIPDGSGPFAGMLFQHGMPSTRQPLIPGAVTYARMGAVVLLIDAPFARRGDGLTNPITFTEQDRREQIQLIVDLRRGVDLLLSRPEVDPQRLAYVGTSYGGAMGGLLAGVEDRLQGYALQVGDGGLVTHLTGPEDADSWQSIPANVRRQWVAWMWPIEPIHYIGCAAPAALLFQNGTLDQMVPPADALSYQQAGSQPKTTRWYRNGHGLGVASGRDQAEWLSQTIGIASHPPAPRSAVLAAWLLAAWFLFTTASLAVMAWEVWKIRPAPYGARLMWLLTTFFLGILGLASYWISVRQTRPGMESGRQGSPARQAVGSASWVASGNVLGGIGVLALQMYCPNVFGANLFLQIAITFLLPFCAGMLVSMVSRWLSMRWDGDEFHVRRPVFVEMISTCLVLVGLYPTVSILIGRYLGRWTAPFGFDLSYPPIWGALCLGALAGALVAYPFHLWLLRRRLIEWGVSGQPDQSTTRRVAWYFQVAAVLLSLAVMLAAIFLAMQIA